MDELVKAFILSGGLIKHGITRKAKGYKTFKGRYSMTVAGLSRKGTTLRNQGIYSTGVRT